MKSCSQAFRGKLPAALKTPGGGQGPFPDPPQRGDWSSGDSSTEEWRPGHVPEGFASPPSSWLHFLSLVSPQVPGHSPQGPVGPTAPFLGA